MLKKITNKLLECTWQVRLAKEEEYTIGWCNTLHKIAALSADYSERRVRLVRRYGINGIMGEWETWAQISNLKLMMSAPLNRKLFGREPGERLAAVYGITALGAFLFMMVTL